MFTVRRLKGYRQLPTFVTWELLHRRAMLHESHERTNRRPTAQWSRLEAGRS
jgi:hypothetical protein